ncbi:MAG: hydrophobic protein, partial [Actinobacteria bacterium]
LVLLLVIAFLLLGFWVVKWLLILAVIVALLWIVGFFVRGAEGARWYRW